MNLPIGILVARKELITKLLNKDFTAKTSMKLKILFKEISKYIDVYEEERIKLVKKYGTEIEDNITVPEHSKNWESFVAELNDVADQKVDLIYPDLTEEDLTSSNINISVRDLIDMEVFYVA